MNSYLGIDLGTTNTVTSIAREGNNGCVEVETIKITQIGEDGVSLEDDQLLPSVLYADENDIFIGRYANAMKTQKRRNIICNSKNFMGEQKVWRIQGREYTPQVVASYILSSVRKHLENTYGDKMNLSSAVITVPASFDMDQKNATRDAARLAGFEKVTLISEPTAALLDFINEQRRYKDESKYVDFREGSRVLVFDLGGGTCDVSILQVKMEGDSVSLDEIAVSPHTLVGGVNFDNYAVEGIIKSFERKNNVDLSTKLNKNEYDDLRNSLTIRCEKAKTYFSGRYAMNRQRGAEDPENIKAYTVAIPNAIDGKPFIYDLTYEEYNSFVSPLLRPSTHGIKNIVDPIGDTLEKAGLISEDIDYVFCVGGMTIYPKVNETIEKALNKKPITVMDRMYSVSRGAAVFQHYSVEMMEREEGRLSKTDINVIPSMPQSVFLNVRNGFPITLIEAGTKCGTPKVYKDLIYTTSEVSTVLELYAGRDLFDPDMRRLKKLTLNFPKGVRRDEGITLKIEYTLDGMLNFQAWITKNESMKVGVSLDNALSSEAKIMAEKKKYDFTNSKGVM